MASLRSLIDDRPKEKTKGFAVTMIHYSKLIPSEANNYSTENIEELAKAILLSGEVKQNLLARKRSPDEYELIAGHRRRLAVKYLVEELGLEEYSMMPVHVERDGDVLSEINLILANCSARERTDWEKMMEVTRLTELVKELQNGTEEEQKRFQSLFGRTPSIGGRELRKMIAESLGLSETRVANLKHIDGNLIPELKDKFQAGEIGVSVANEAAGLPVEEQVELSKREKIQLSDVRKKSVSESDTDLTEEKGDSIAKEIDITNHVQSGVSVENGMEPDSNAVTSISASRNEEKVVVMEESEPLSAHGTPRKVYPEGSLLTSEGCESTPDGPKGGYNCFSCARECGIRQKERYCVEAPLGNPFPCDRMDGIGTLREIMGDQCQFVNLDLAYRRQGDGEPVPCCKDCSDPCDLRCSRVGLIVPVPGSEPEPDSSGSGDLNETSRPEKFKTYDRDILEKMISDAENEMELMRNYWIQDGPRYYTQKAMEIQAYKNLLVEHDAEEAARSGLVENPDLKQPELPVLKSDNQIKEWLKNYKFWGLWYRDEYIDVNYYKFDFDNGSRLIVAEFPQRENDWSSDKYDRIYYHLVEKGKKKYRGEKIYDEKYQDSPTSETELVEYLKKIQKKERGKE